MKKLTLFLLVLLSLAVVVGCQANRKTVTRFSAENEETEASAQPSKAETTPTEIKTEPVAAGVPFEVTSLQKNISDPNKGYHLIEGTTPAETARIMVNGYPLSKYKAGDTKWSYIAAISLGNLKKGDNPFTVKAFDKSGKELGAKSFTITYKASETASLPATGPDSIMFLLPMAIAAAYALLARSVRRGRRRA